MGTIDKRIKRDDVTLVYKHPHAKVDIILLHGLNGNPTKTWTAANQVYWPTDLLPRTLEEAGVQANILVYGYNADIIGTKEKKLNTTPIHMHAQTLVTYLTTFRKHETSSRNPIIWVAHSLGGILLKRALQYSDNMRASTHEDQRAIYVSTFAIVFLGTPHEGSDLAKWGEFFRGVLGMAPRKMFELDSPLIKTLCKDSETLDNINASFIEIQQRFKIHLVYESQKTDLKGTMALIVDPKSAAPRWYNTTSYGIEADHSGMCKFSSVNAPGYRQITSVITDWSLESLEFIAYRWAAEDQDRRMRAQRNLNELASQLLPDLASGIPPAVGMLSPPQVLSPSVVSGSPAQSEHVEGDADTGGGASTPGGLVSTNSNALNAQLLQNAPPSPLPTLPMLPASQSVTQDSIRSHDTASESAPEYYRIVPEGFRSNSYFVGRKTELKQLHRMLQDRKRRSQGTSTVLVHCQTGGGKTHMAREYFFQHLQDYPGGMFWLRASSVQELEGEFSRVAKVALKQLRTKVDKQDLEDPAKMIDHVRNWFEGNENWLLVLDGIMFDQEGIERFFPDHINTSMILLSTSSAVSGDYHFNNPRPLQLPSLSTQEAQELLLMEIEKEPPFTQDDLARAAELAHILDKLPLMIHVIAQHLKSSQEPLSTYLKRYKSKPPKLGRMPAYELVLEQMQARGAIAALNVLCMLAFLDQHTPVEMLSLGLRVLDHKETPYKTRDALTHDTQSLNNTLKVLIAFALVERSDRYSLSRASSQTSKRSFDPSEEVMDTLHVHTVVQRYMIEYLAERRLHIFWLERSVEVFLSAVFEADRRIKEKPHIGLPDDYRRLSLHGRKLMQHLVHYETKHIGELQPIRKQLEAELQVIEKEIIRLTKGSQSELVNQPGGSLHISVFDKAKGLSDSDTGTTASHPGSQQAWTPGEEGPSGFFESPIESRFSQGYNDQVTPYPVDDDVPTPQARLPLSQLDTPVPADRKGRRSSSSSTRDRFSRIMKENIPNIPFLGRRRKSSTSTINKAEGLVPTSARTSPGGEYTATMPFMPPIEPRSAKSSPGHGATVPFTPPSLQSIRTSVPRTKQNPPPSFQQWNTTPYAPRQHLSRVESSSLGLDTKAAPYGSPGSTISPPMSRESSRPPSTSRGRGSNDSFASNLAIPGTARRARRTSSPLSRPTSIRPVTARQRREASGRYSTSPSPSSPHDVLTATPFPSDIARPISEPQKMSATSDVVSRPAFVSMPPVPSTPSAPASKLSWLEQSKIGRIFSGKGRSKASSTAAEPVVANTASNEAMGNSRSGGFIIGDGDDRQIISFGDVAVPVGDARDRLQRRLQHPQAQRVSSRPNGQDEHNAGLGITRPPK